MNLRLLYLYLFSFVGLIIVVMGSIQMVNLGLKMTLFKEADIYEVYDTPKVAGELEISAEEKRQRQVRDVSRQRQRDLVSAISMLVVGTPLYLYHWNIIKKESKKS